MKITQLRQLIKEEIKLVLEYTPEYDSEMRQWNAGFIKYLTGKKLGNLKVDNLKEEQPGMVSFSVETGGNPNLILEFSLTNQDRSDKQITRIEITSPNKKGLHKFTTSGKNASPQGVWNAITKLYNR